MPDTICRTKNSDIRFAVAVKIGGRGNVRRRSEINRVESIGGRFQTIPRTTAVNGDVGFAVAVVIRRNGFVADLSELRNDKRIILAAVDIPNAV